MPELIAGKVMYRDHDYSRVSEAVPLLGWCARLFP